MIDNVARRSGEIMEHVKRTMPRRTFRRLFDDIASVACLVALESMEGHKTSVWACREARRRIYREQAWERRLMPLTGRETAKRQPRPRPIPRRYFVQCSPAQEFVLRLAYERDFGQADLSRATGASESTVRTHLRRGLERVRMVVA